MTVDIFDKFPTKQEFLDYMHMVKTMPQVAENDPDPKGYLIKFVETHRDVWFDLDIQAPATADRVHTDTVHYVEDVDQEEIWEDLFEAVKRDLRLSIAHDMSWEELSKYATESQIKMLKRIRDIQIIEKI